MSQLQMHCTVAVPMLTVVSFIHRVAIHIGVFIHERQKGM